MRPASKAKVLVTGANGFVGRAVVARLLADEVDVVGAVRYPTGAAWETLSPSLSSSAEWHSALVDRSVVVHTAARAHILNEKVKRPLDIFRQVNTEGTLRLAEQAAGLGVRRFIFISSIGVNGGENVRPFTEGDPPAPREPYAISKHEAELALLQLAERTGMEVVILRPPLVYGPWAPGNFGRLLHAVAHGVPLPLGAVTENRRTLVALENLVDLIVTCITHPLAANQVFLAGDSEDLSTAELLCRLGRAMEVPLRLFSVPVWILSAGALIVGKRAVLDRLCGSLQIDIGKAKELLDWTPPVSVDIALKNTVRPFFEHRIPK